MDNNLREIELIWTLKTNYSPMEKKYKKGRLLNSSDFNEQKIAKSRIMWSSIQVKYSNLIVIFSFETGVWVLRGQKKLID